VRDHSILIETSKSIINQAWFTQQPTTDSLSRFKPTFLLG